MTYDPNYKLKHKPPPVHRLAYYKRLPPPMVGDPRPDLGWHCKNPWKQRCEAVYAAMMAFKHGTVPPRSRVGLWYYDVDTDHYRQA